MTSSSCHFLPSFLFALLPVRLKCKGLGGSVSGSCVCARATSDMNPEVKPGNKKGMRPGPWKLEVGAEYNSPSEEVKMIMKANVTNSPSQIVR